MDKEKHIAVWIALGGHVWATYHFGMNWTPGSEMEILVDALLVFTLALIIAMPEEA